MDGSEDVSGHSDGVVYEVRALRNRWVEPHERQVISSHTSATAAMAAVGLEPRFATDGAGPSSHGTYVAKVVVRVDSQGHESMVLAPPSEGGTVAWPYPN